MKFFFLSLINHLSLLHKQYKSKYSVFSQTPTDFAGINVFFRPFSSLVKSPMDACLLYSHEVGTWPFVSQLMLRHPSSFITTKAIADTSYRDRRQAWALWPSTFLCYAGFLLPFLVGSILMTDTVSLPGAPLMCLTLGLSPGLKTLLTIFLS